MLLFGINGLGDSYAGQCDPNTQYWDDSSQQCLPFASTPAPNAYSGQCNSATQYWDPGSNRCLPFAAAGAGATSAGQPWYAGVISAVAQGTAAGLTTKPAATPVLAASAPWYTTPIGIGAIVIGGLALFMVLRK